MPLQTVINSDADMGFRHPKAGLPQSGKNLENDFYPGQGSLGVYVVGQGKVRDLEMIGYSSLQRIFC